MGASETASGTAPSECEREPPAKAADSGAQQRVLVVDDHRDAARILSLLLDTLGHAVRTAHNSQEALDAATAFKPDVVLLDIGLPQVDGYQVARQLRALPGGKSLKLVALTGWGHEEDRRRSREAGFDLHLVKPVTSKTLREVLAGAP